MNRPLTDFENWCFHAHDENGQLYLTNLFTIACGNKPGQFEEGRRIIHAAFEAGKQSGLNVASLTAQQARTNPLEKDPTP